MDLRSGIIITMILERWLSGFSRSLRRLFCSASWFGYPSFRDLIFDYTLNCCVRGLYVLQLFSESLD